MASGYVVGQVRVGRGAADGFYHFSLLLQPFTNINSNVVHQRKGKDIFTNSRWAIYALSTIG
jgi:hypothetical protein